MIDNKCKVYVLFEPVTQDIRYVGQTTKRIAKRINDHLSDARRNHPGHLYNWMRRCVVEQGGIGYLVINSNATWNETEIEMIKKCKDLGCNLVNKTDGGKGSLGYKATEETIRKLSESHKGHVHSEEHKEKIASKLRGRKFSENTRKKISVAIKGRVSPMKGRNHSLETIEKFRSIHTGKKLSEETKQKISMYFSGKPRPERYKKVQCIENGNVFESVSAAAKWVGDSTSHISRSCRRGDMVRGFHWRYYNG